MDRYSIMFAYRRLFARIDSTADMSHFVADRTVYVRWRAAPIVACRAHISAGMVVDVPYRPMHHQDASGTAIASCLHTDGCWCVSIAHQICRILLTDRTMESGPHRGLPSSYLSRHGDGRAIPTHALPGRVRDRCSIIMFHTEGVSIAHQTCRILLTDRTVYVRWRAAPTVACRAHISADMVMDVPYR